MLFDKKLFYFLIVVSFCSTPLLNAQKQLKPGYIINSNNDTIQGLINDNSYKNLHFECEFKSISGTKSVFYSPNEISGFSVNDDMLFVSKEIKLNNKSEKVFLEFLVNGVVNLYLLRSQEADIFFIEKEGIIYELSNEEISITGENGEKYTKNSNQYIGRLSYLFQDSPESVGKLKATPFRVNPLIEITKSYHQDVCTEYSCIDYTKSDKINLSLEIFAGNINSVLGLKTSSDNASSSCPYFGFNIKLQPSRLNKIFDIYSGINYSKIDFQGEFVNTLNDMDLEQTYRIYQKHTAVKIPLGLSFTIPTKKISPYFSAAYINTFLLNIDNKVELVNYFPGTDREISSYKIKPTSPKTYHAGFSVGLGLKYRLQNESIIFLKGEYEYRRTVSNTGYIDEYFNIKSFIISAGYSFSIN